MTPYSEIPKHFFLARVSIPLALFFLFLFFCVGVVANSLEFQQHTGPSVVNPFWITAFNHYTGFFLKLTHIPDVCWPGRAVNDFQAHQCEIFWDELIRVAELAAAPFVCVGLAFFLGLETLKATYKNVHKKVEQGKALYAGTVTTPAEGPADVFSWFYCLRPVMVQLPDRTQIKVYVPLGSVAPTPGQTLAIFEPVNSLGEKRHLGLIYTPHVAVVRGS